MSLQAKRGVRQANKTHNGNSTGSKHCAKCECVYKHKIGDEHEIRVLFKSNLFVLCV